MNFSELGLSPKVLEAVTASGYTTPTPIQAEAIPRVLERRDVLGIAQTGTGKTAAFTLPMITLLEQGRARARMPRTLILEPTRELAAQVEESFVKYGSGQKLDVALLIGGVSFGDQDIKITRGVDVLIATPGRLLDHFERGKLLLTGIEILVIDEADRMLDMGFADDIVKIASQCPAKRQTLLFSATYPEGIAKLAARYLREPVTVKVEAQHGSEQIEQRWYEVQEDQRLLVVASLLAHFRPVSTLAFCNTKARCRELVELLQAQGYSALALHGDLEQRDRDQVLVRFVNGSCSVLVATDVAARGLDVAGLAAVVNVDISTDPYAHLHRIGRTGRAGQTGLVLSLTALAEMDSAVQIERLQGRPSVWHALNELTPTPGGRLRPEMATVHIQAGRKEKIRPGDVLGALTADLGYTREQVGKIDINEFATYVAVKRGIASEVVERLNSGRIKGRAVKARLL